MSKAPMTPKSMIDVAKKGGKPPKAPMPFKPSSMKKAKPRGK